MRARIISLICLLLSIQKVTAQSCDTVAVNQFCKESQDILRSDVDKAYAFAQQAMKASENCPNTVHYYKAILSLSKAYSFKDMNDSVIVLLQPLITNLPANLPEYYRGSLNKQLGSAYINVSKFTLALKYTIDALRIFETIKDTINSINSLINTANIYQQQHNFKQADKILRDAEKMILAGGNLTLKGNVYNTMGILYAEHNQLDSAEKFFLKSTEARESLKDMASLPWNYNNLGGLYLLMRKNKEGAMYLEKALELFKQQGNFDGQSSIANNLGELYFQLENPIKALEYYKYSRSLYPLTNDMNNLENLYLNLFKYYKEMGDANTAIMYSDSVMVLKDTIYGHRLDETMAEMQTKYQSEKKDLELAKNKAQFESDKNKRFITYGALAFFVLLALGAVWAFMQKRKTNNLLESKNSLLESANHKISVQKEELTEKQHEIVDSINYAKKIQDALLANEEFLLEHSLNHFILFKPKDIVSGDFTWAAKTDGFLYLACCDSTGHGVPGAFMSLLNIGFLSEAIKKRNISEPGKIFDYVRNRLIETIGKDKQQDGFDGILICVDLNQNKIAYAAANNAPVLIRNGELIHLTCNKMPVGKGVKEDSFDTYTLHYEPNDKLYLYTDGYADQFGGPKGKKFKYKPLEEILLNNAEAPVKTQSDILNNAFEVWRGNLEQVDDVCIVGLML